MRFGPCLGNKGLEFSFLKHPAYITVRIVKIAEVHALGRAYCYTGRLHSQSYPVYAKGAFVDIAFRMRITCIVGA